MGQNKKIKILFIMPSLGKGGAERVILTLCNNIDLNLFDCTLLLLEERGGYIKELRPEIRLESLGIKNVKKSFFALKRYVNEKKPDIVFGSLSHLNLMLLLVRFFVNRKIRFVVRESSIPSIHNKGAFSIGETVMNVLYRIFYRNAAVIIAQCEYMKNDLCHSFRIPKEKVVVINNPVDVSFIQRKAKSDNSLTSKLTFTNFLIVGSLVELKQYDHVLTALSQVNNKRWKLTVLGDGPEMDRLKLMSEKLGISNNIDFLGRVNNPYSYMKSTDCLVVTSKYEGFPNGVLEILVLGKPVIAYNAPGGIAEILQDGVNSILLLPNDRKGLAKALQNFDRVKFDEDKIRDVAVGRYDSKIIMERFQKIFSEISR